MKFTKITLALIACVATSLLAGCPPSGPSLDLSASTLHFGIEGGEYVTSQTIDISNDGASDSTLNFSASSNKPWLTIDPATGTLIGTDGKITVTITIDRDYSELKQLVAATAEITVVATDAADEEVGSGVVQVTTAPNYYTQDFESGNDLANTQILFEENGGPSFYGFSTTNNVQDFGTDPDGGLLLDFNAFGDPVEAGLFGGAEVEFYGQLYDTLYVSSEGWVSMGEPGGSATLEQHFAVPQVSGLPVDATSGNSMVSYLQTADRLVVTYEDAPSDISKGNNTNDFQFEFYFNGNVRMTFLNTDSSLSGIVGLSAGLGDGTSIPADFLETDLNTP